MICDFFGPYNKPAPGMYSKDHFILLAIFLSLVISGLILLRKASKEKVRIVTLVFAIVITILEIIKIYYTYKVSSLRYFDQWLPIQYCSLFIYACWLATFKNKKICKLGSIFLSSGGLIAGAVYLSCPTTSLSFVGMDHFLAIHAFTFHSSMLFIGLLYIIRDYYRPKFKDYIYYFIFFTIFAIIAIVLDYKRGENLMIFYEAFMLPKLLVDIEAYSKPLFTFCIYFGYNFIFFVPTTLIFIINKIRKKKD